MKKYFFLKRHCFVLTGKNGAAIYDLYNKLIYNIDLTVGELLLNCEQKRIPLREYSLFSSLNKKNELLKYLDELSKIGLGDFFEKNTIVEKVKPMTTKKELNNLGFPPPFLKLWIESESRCNFNCIHCFKKNSGISRCSCSKEVNTKTLYSIPFEGLKKLIDEAVLLNCQEIYIIGGEPLLQKDKLFNIIKYIRNIHFNKLVVQSNGFLLNIDDLKLFVVNNVIWRTFIFSYKQEIHDQITGVSGSWNRVVSNIKNAIKIGVNISILIEILKTNQDHVEKTVDFIKSLGVSEVTYDLVFDNDPQLFPDKFINRLIKNEDNIQAVSKEEFFRNMEGNPCWDGKLAIKANGDILPCIMAHEEVIGNIKNDSIKDLIRFGKIDKWWNHSKNKIKICKNCEFRYACFDCRPRESVDDSLEGRTKYCSFY